MTQGVFQATCLRLDPYDDASRRELYAVRFHSTVRPFMANSSLIPYRRHVDWARDHLGGKALQLWLVRPPGGGRAFGFTQLQLDPDGANAEIGVMFRDPQLHRLRAAVATAMTLAIAFRVLGYQSIRSHVAVGHAHAIGFNQGWGGRESPSARPGQVCLTASGEAWLVNPRYRRLLARWVDDVRLLPPADASGPVGPASPLRP
jgi:hypothetical protein